jgi:hypothetical protein
MLPSIDPSARLSLSPTAEKQGELWMKLVEAGLILALDLLQIGKAHKILLPQLRPALHSFSPR